MTQATRDIHGSETEEGAGFGVGKNEGVGVGYIFQPDQGYRILTTRTKRSVTVRKATMGDNGGQIISTEEAVLASLIVVNDEFQKMICKECELAVGLGMVGTHLSKRHGVKRDMAQRIANMIDMGEWGCVEVSGKKFKEPKKPNNGTRPQEWLVVYDGLQCKFCREFQARSVDEVESHWYGAGHGRQREQ